MNLSSALRLYAQAAGGQSEVAERGDSQTVALLKRKQDKLDKSRRRVTPYPEDKRQLQGGALTNTLVRDPTQTPSPSEIADQGYKYAMKRKWPKFPLHTAPGTQPLQTVTGSQVQELKCIIEKRGGKFHVFSEDRSRHLGGPYATREKAQERIAQVEYFKHRGK